nr:MAG TPA: hypothetical protein [Caudoviricetes sp.]
MCDLLASRLQPCVLIRNQFSDLFFVVFNGDARNRTEKLEKHRRENHFTPVTAKTRPKPRKNIIKYKGDINERNRGRDSNPQRLYDTLISGTSLFNS